MNIDLVNVIGGFIIAGATLLVTFILSRHKPKVDRQTAAVAEKQIAVDSLKAVSSEWREYAHVQAERASSAEAAAKAAAAAAEECRELARVANSRAERVERYNSILISHWPVGHSLPDAPNQGDRS